MKFPDSAVRQILFDTLVEMGKLDSNPTAQTIQTINEISEPDVLKLLRSLGVGPTISKAKGGMMQGIQTLKNGGEAHDDARAKAGISRKRTEAATKTLNAIRDRNKALQGLSGRDKGIATQYALSQKDKEKRLSQSVGSLDRRIEKAISASNTDQAKDLRSRQNVFAKKLADQRVLQSGSFFKDKYGRAIKDSLGRPIANTQGANIRDLSMQLDFINPTRRLFYKYPKEMGKMYPVQNYFEQGGLYGMAADRFFPQSQQQKLETYKKNLRYPEVGGIYGEGMFPSQRYPLAANLEPLDDTKLDTIKQTKESGINTIKQPYMLSDFSIVGV